MINIINTYMILYFFKACSYLLFYFGFPNDTVRVLTSPWTLHLIKTYWEKQLVKTETQQGWSEKFVRPPFTKFYLIMQKPKVTNDNQAPLVINKNFEFQSRQGDAFYKYKIRGDSLKVSSTNQPCWQSTLKFNFIHNTYW